MRKALKVIEWTLLVVVGGYALSILLAPIDWFERDPKIQEAKKNGYYYKVDSEKQAFYNKKFQVEGVIYGNDDLIIYMKGNKLPIRVQVTTDTNETLTSSSGGKTNGVFTADGYFRFKDVPQGIKEITIHQQSYQESFSFRVPLAEGGDAQ